MNKAYKCINSFISSTGRRYAIGTLINHAEYKSLWSVDAANFRLTDEHRSEFRDHEESDLLDDIVTAGVGLALDAAIDSLFDSDSSGSSSGSGSSFEDFGGGEFGGSGASGDW